MGMESVLGDGSGGSSLSSSTASISSRIIPRIPGGRIEAESGVLSQVGGDVSCAMGASVVAVGGTGVGAGVIVELLVGDVIWPDGSSTNAVPNDLLSLVWTDLARICSSRRYSLSSARFKRAALPRRVRNLVRIVPKTLQRRSTEAELGQMERIRRANRASGVSGWFG